MTQIFRQLASSFKETFLDGFIKNFEKRTPLEKKVIVIAGIIAMLAAIISGWSRAKRFQAKEISPPQNPIPNPNGNANPGSADVAPPPTGEAGDSASLEGESSQIDFDSTYLEKSGFVRNPETRGFSLPDYPSIQVILERGNPPVQKNGHYLIINRFGIAQLLFVQNGTSFHDIGEVYRRIASGSYNPEIERSLEYQEVRLISNGTMIDQETEIFEQRLDSQTYYIIYQGGTSPRPSPGNRYFKNRFEDIKTYLHANGINQKGIVRPKEKTTQTTQ